MVILYQFLIFVDKLKFVNIKQHNYFQNNLTNKYNLKIS